MEELNMLKKCRIIIILSIIFLMLFGFNAIVNADMGPKPSITIHLKNMKTSNYTIDLFEYAEKTKDYYPDSNFSSNGRCTMNLKDGIKDKNGITVYFDDIAQLRRNNSQTSRNLI